MKKKTTTYVLGIVVLLIWGLVYRSIRNAVGSDEDDTPIISRALPKDPYNDYTIPKDTTHLLLNYRDPFGLVKWKDTTIVTKPVRLSLKPTTPKPAMDWSFIKYSGYIRNPNSKKLVAILTINGKSVMMADGETSDDVKLIKNLRDSVQVSFKGKTKFIVIHPETI